MPRPPLSALAILTVALACWGPLTPGAAAQHAEPAASKAGGAAVEDGSAIERGEGGDNQNILAPQWQLGLWTVVVFVALLLVLGRYAWGPLSKALHDREHHLAATLEEAESARRRGEALIAEHRALMAQAADQSRAILDEARAAAEATAAEIVRKAQAEAESSKDRAAKEIQGARDQALTEIWTKTADLAVSVAGRVLARDLGPDDQRRMVEVAMSELPSANGAGAARS